MDEPAAGFGMPEAGNIQSYTCPKINQVQKNNGDYGLRAGEISPEYYSPDGFENITYWKGMSNFY